MSEQYIQVDNDKGKKLNEVGGLTKQNARAEIDTDLLADFLDKQGFHEVAEKTRADAQIPISDNTQQMLDEQRKAELVKTLAELDKRGPSIQDPRHGPQTITPEMEKEIAKLTGKTLEPHSNSELPVPRNTLPTEK